MKRPGIHKFSDIESFDDFRYETDRLVLKSRLVETRLQISFHDITSGFTLSGLIFSLARTLVMPKLSDLLGFLMRKIDIEDLLGK